MPRPGRIRGVVTVDDGSTLFELCITHALMQHLDQVLVLDHSAGRGVAAALARLADSWADRVAVVRPPRQQRPADLLQQHADLAAEDWIHWFAADEFGLVGGGASLRELLADVPSTHAAVRCHVDHWVSMHDFDAADAARVLELRFRAEANVFVGDEAGVLADEVACGTVNAFDMPPPPRLFLRAAAAGQFAGPPAADRAVAVPPWSLAADHYRVARVPLPDRESLELRCDQNALGAPPSDPTASAWFAAVFESVAGHGELSAFWHRHSLPCRATGIVGSRPRVVRDDSLAEAIGAAVTRLVGPVQEGRSWGDGGVRADVAGYAARLAAAVGTLGDLEARLELSERQRDAAVQERIAAVAARIGVEAHRDAIATHRDAIAAHRDTVVARRDAAVRERNAAVEQRDDAVHALDAMVRERDAVIRERDAAFKERDAAVRERDGLVDERDAAVEQRDDAVQARDAMMRERDAAVGQRDTLLRERDVRERARIPGGPPVAIPAVGAATGGVVEAVLPTQLKVFGVGWAKTGTTTLGCCYEILGLDHQGPDLSLVKDLKYGDLDRIMALARRRQAFEDWPWPILYRELDEAFPGSRFILTVRSPDRWLESYRGMLATEGPATDELNEVRSILYGLDFPEVRDADLVARYTRHNADVRRYFADRPGCLLVVDWEAGSGWRELCGFLGVDPPRVPFPHANRGRHAAATRAPPS